MTHKFDASGYAAGIGKSVLFGTTTIFNTILLMYGDVFDVLAGRYMISTIIFLIMQAFGMIKVQMKGRDIKILVITAMFSPVIQILFETTGVKYSTNIVAGSMTALMPAFALIMEMAFLKERTSTSEKLFMVLRMLGVFLIAVCAKSSGENTLMGIIFMLLSVVCGAAYCIASRKASKSFEPITVTYFGNILAAIIFNSINIGRHAAAGSMGDYLSMFTNIHSLLPLIGLGSVSIIANWLNNYALSRLQASLISSFGGLTTLTTIFLGIVLRNEKFYLYHGIGVILILVGIVGMSFAGEKRKRLAAAKNAS